MGKIDNNIFISDVEVPEIVQKKADEAFSKIRMEGMDVMRKKRYSFISPVAAAICVCILAAGSMTVAAAVYHYWSRGMQGNIQATPKQQSELIDNGITTILNEDVEDNLMAVTSGNVTIKPLEIISDEHFAHISFSVEGYYIGEQIEPGFEYISVYTGEDKNDENGWVDMYGSFYNGIVAGSDGRPVYDNGEALEYTEDGATIEHFKAQDGTLEYVMMLCAPDIDDSLLGKTVHVEFANLGTVYKTEYENAVDGEWVFDIAIPENSTAELCKLDKALGDSGAMVRTVEFSPISIKIDYDFEGSSYEEEIIDEDGKIITSTSYTEPPRFTGVRLKDGTQFQFIINGGMTGYTDESRKEYYYLMSFDRVIDIDQVDALLFQKPSPSGGGEFMEDNFYVVEFNVDS
ncbi:MAG: DUF4179 domain-containing protein [Lachnospiraceae bacterium]|nr:DUF4179 domain-containing protein [Lachnospiraceae bacterium]